MFHGVVATVYVSDLDRAVAFYTDVLGFTVKLRTATAWVSIDAGPGVEIGLHLAEPASRAPGVRGSEAIGLYTDDFEGAVARLAAAGVRFTGEPVDNGFTRFVEFCDPDGNDLYVCQRYGA